LNYSNLFPGIGIELTVDALRKTIWGTFFDDQRTLWFFVNRKIRRRGFLINSETRESCLITLVLITLSLDCVEQARPLKTKELSDPEISRIIGEKMAQIHSLDVPISKEPTWLWDTMGRWMDNTRMILSSAKILPGQEEAPAARILRLMPNLDGESEWLRAYLTQLRSPVVFCHNDLQEGNILIRENAASAEEKLVIIDFEYCSYNYRYVLVLKTIKT